MKKKLLLTLSVASVATIALASCGDAKSNLNTNKDFTITAPEADSDAKLLKAEEKQEYFDNICVDQATSDEELKDYKENYNSLVMLSQYNNVFTSDTNNGEYYVYSKTVYDYNSNIGWHYEKAVIKYNDDNGKPLNFVNEIETKFVLKDNYYIVKTDFKLDRLIVHNSNIDAGDWSSYALANKCVSGSAKLYTKVNPQESNAYLDSKENLSSFTSLVKDGYRVNNYLNSSCEVYVKDNYIYDIVNSGSSKYQYKSIRVKKPLFAAYYLISESKSQKREQFYELYLSKDSILDDSMYLDGYTEYEVEQEFSYDEPLPFYSNHEALFADSEVNDPNNIYDKYFTVE
ncbi:hypothetical protein EI71_01277 [Anaeroplasma bactoclasticum]|jgi:hypothetical protein|uniref:Lipoprotein n=1 Tax=Anaeroplasma bactoclasticum TaxID=2088 RepID=A0A397RPT8_9MOLU|nr:hypothetical protein [Anaeroplasma bactoclasticum]RIA75708.1 hypothetical protein EI71_01277 [Anaeroplasma bactoclasticum]